MPRQARKNLATSFIHVMVQGVNKEYIFYKEKYIEKYLEILIYEQMYNKEEKKILFLEGVPKNTEIKTKQERRIATDENGNPCNWYLRTPDTWDDDVITCIEIDGTHKILFSEIFKNH